jgi:DNA repair protein RecO (recombination protein O)
MEKQVTALIIYSQKQGENNLLVTLFSKENGVFKSIVRAGAAKKRIAHFQVGNVLEGCWKGRLEENLGNFSGVVVKNYNSLFLRESKKILILKTITEVLALSIREGQSYDRLFDDTLEFLDYIAEHDVGYEDYVGYELRFLKDLGFGIDLSRCSLSGKKDNLYYISPNTGHAATREAGKIYHNNLLILPGFLRGGGSLDDDELERSFKLSGYFIDKRLLDPYGKKMPFSRKLLQGIFAS